MDSIETEKSRIVLYELEKDWWILASVDLTRLPAANTHTVEYSSREVAPSRLLLQQLLQAHSIFLLHQATSLADLYLNIPRDEFCNRLDRFWTKFIHKWDVLLHGNPAIDIYNGAKLAAGGELGIGVGEEELGSAEREVLEGFVDRTAGLVDLLVSRFGHEAENASQRPSASSTKQNHMRPWLGTDQDPRPSDGIIFSGVGAVSRKSVTTISQWMGWIFKYGEGAYGVGESPSSKTRRKRRATVRQTGSKYPPDAGPRSLASRPSPSIRPPPSSDLRRRAMHNRANSPGIPPPLVTVVEQSLQKATSDADTAETTDVPVENISASSQAEDNFLFDPSRMKKYLTLGYGSSWSFSTPKSTPLDPQISHRTEERSTSAFEADLTKNTTSESSEYDSMVRREEDPLTEIVPIPEPSDEETHPYVQPIEPPLGRFLIGLIEDFDLDAKQSPTEETSTEGDQSPELEENSRIALRTLIVEMDSHHSSMTPTSEHPQHRESQKSSPESPELYHKVRVALYVHQPFIFTFLFAVHTPSLAYPTFYRSIDHQLGPLQKPLLNSTDPKRAIERIASSLSDRETNMSSPSLGLPLEPIYDLFYDPAKLTIRSSIPNIPIPGTRETEGLSNPTSSHYASGSWLTLGIPTSASYTPQSSALTPSATSVNRIQALNIHTHILNMHASTRQLPHEVERSVKTSRGFWVLWMKIPPHISETLNPTLNVEARVEEMGSLCKEAFIVRSVSENVGRKSGAASPAERQRTTSAGRWLMMDRVVSGSSDGSAREGHGAVTEGVGGNFDARSYIEALIRVNR